MLANEEEGADLKEHVENVQEQVDQAQNPEYMAPPDVHVLSQTEQFDRWWDNATDVFTVDAEEVEQATGVNPHEDRLANDPRDYLNPAPSPDLQAGEEEDHTAGQADIVDDSGI
jgi:hypothetical protein